MKNTLKRILETQEIYHVDSNNSMFTYMFNTKPDESFVLIERVTNVSQIFIADNLRNIFEADQMVSCGNNNYYRMRINGIYYYVSVTVEEDLYFQSLLQNSFKKYQLKLFETINSEINKSIEQQKLSASQKFEKELQDTVNNDKE